MLLQDEEIWLVGVSLVFSQPLDSNHFNANFYANKHYYWATASCFRHHHALVRPLEEVSSDLVIEIFKRVHAFSSAVNFFRQIQCTGAQLQASKPERGCVLNWSYCRSCCYTYGHTNFAGMRALEKLYGFSLIQHFSFSQWRGPSQSGFGSTWMICVT